jgi:hypothetical protein
MTLGEQRRKALELLAPPPSRRHECASCWQRRPQIAFRGLLVGRSLVEFALRYCQVLKEVAKPRQI